AGAVAGARIGANRAAMLEIAEDVHRVGDDLMRLLALDIGDEADAAGILLQRGIVETLGGRPPVVFAPRILVQRLRRFRGRGRRQHIRGDVFALELRPVHLKSSSIRLGASPSLGAPWAFAAPTGPPLVLREPQFHKLRPGRPTSPVDGPAFYFPGAGAPDFVAILVPGLRPQLRQYDCPNSDHAKFFSTTQAPESRRSHATSVLRRGAAASPRI